MNTRKNAVKRKKRTIFSGYKLRGDYFGRKLIALVSLSVLVMAAGVFAFAEFGEDDEKCVSCGLTGCECLLYSDSCYCEGDSGDDCCGNECTGCTDCSCENDGDCSVGACESCGGECASCGGECDTGESCCAGDETVCGCGVNCSCGLGDNCNCIDDGTGGSNCTCGGSCDCDNHGDQCSCSGGGEEGDDPRRPCETYLLYGSCGCGDDYYNCYWCNRYEECICAVPAPLVPPAPTGEYFRFEVTTTVPGQTFYIPLSGFSGSRSTSAYVNITNASEALTAINQINSDNHIHSYNWNIEWTNGVEVRNIDMDYNVSTQEGDGPEPGQNREGIPIDFAKAGTHTITITPNGDLGRWFAAFGFGISPLSDSDISQTNKMENKGMLTRVISPLTLLMMRTDRGQRNDNFSFEWGYAFNGCVNLTMAPAFTLAYSTATRVGHYFAAHMFAGITGPSFTMGQSFNIPQNITSIGTGFAYGMFSGCKGDAFTMNTVFNLPQSFGRLEPSFAMRMFENCSGANFNMNNNFNLPEHVVETGPFSSSLASGFAAYMFRGCSGDKFTMNSKFNIPQNLRSNVYYAGRIGNDFMRGTFMGCSGASFNMNTDFNFPHSANFTVAHDFFAAEMFMNCSGDAFTMNSNFNLPERLTTAGNYFAYRMFEGCSGASFNMNSNFILPNATPDNQEHANYYASRMFYGCSGPLFTMNDIFVLRGGRIGSTNYASQMFALCSGDAFNMNSKITFPDTTITPGNQFAYGMFRGCSGANFTMNEVFNLPQRITSSGTQFAQEMFSDCSGDNFNMNIVFNLPQSLEYLTANFAADMFRNASGELFTMNASFNLPQNTRTFTAGTANNMFLGCNGIAFEINDVFVIPTPKSGSSGQTSTAHTQAQLNNDVFRNTFRNIRQGQPRTVESILNEINLAPSTQRNTFSGNGGFGVTNETINNGVFSDWDDVAHTWGGPKPQEGVVTYVFTGLESIEYNTAPLYALLPSTAVKSATDPLSIPALTALCPSNYAIHAWYTDEAFTELFDISTDRVIQDMTLYALDNVAYDHDSAHRTLATSSFGHILVAGEFYLDSTLTVPNGRTVTYDGIKLQGQTAQPSVIRASNNFRHFTVNGSLTFAENCNITLTRTAERIAGTNLYGGGVLVSGSGSSFVMHGGAISKNSASNAGGGVAIQGGASFTMNNGEISENSAIEIGAGVYLNGSGTEFNMNGGSIIDNALVEANSQTGGGGGVAVDTGAAFNMNSGALISNNLARRGGGVYIRSTLDTDAGLTTFTMNSGAIIDSNWVSGDSQGGGGGVYGSGNRVVFNMNGGTISNNRASRHSPIGGGVYIINGSMDMYAGARIINNYAGYDIDTGVIQAGRGGGVCIESNYNLNSTPAEFNMHGGEISGNKARLGGGVQASAGTSTSGNSARGHTVFNMYEGAEIINNEANTNSTTDGGGGVNIWARNYTESRVTFNMHGGKINGNVSTGTATTHGGGVVVTSTGAGKAEVEMLDGEINGNVGRNHGGGVMLNGANSEFNMRGGTISGNRADREHGGGVSVTGGTFTMYNGFITGNISSTHGGGVNVSAGSFIMKKEGVIADNISATGGGISLWGGEAKIYGGSISNNTGNDGGGISVMEGSLTIFSGSITGNTAAVNGGGIFTVNYSSLDIRSGEKGAVFSGNTAGSPYDFGIYNWGESIELTSVNSNSGSSTPARSVSGNPENIKWSLTGNGLSNWGTSIPGTHLLNNYDVNYNRTLTITFNGNATGVQNNTGTTWSNTTNRVLNAIDDGQGGLKGHGGRIAGINPVMPDNRQEPGDYPADPNPGFAIPAAPVRAGYDFIGWSMLASDFETNGDDLQHEFTEHTRVSSNLTVYAQWKPKPMVPSWPETIDFGTNLIQRNGFVAMGKGVGFSHNPSDTVIQIQNPANSNWSIVVQAKTKDVIDGGMADPNCCCWLLASRMYVGETTSIFGAAAPIFENNNTSYAPGSQLDIKWQDLKDGGLMVKNGADFQVQQYQTILDWNIVFAP